MVVHVGEISQNTQSVFIADCKHNILCIYFHESVKTFAYDDIVALKRFVRIENLQCRQYPKTCTYATAYTALFNESSLKIQFSNIDLDAYIEECMVKVRAFQTTTAPSQQSSGSSKTPRRSLLGNRNRIEQLSKYGEPMATPPMHLATVNIPFKTPGSSTNNGALK